MPIYHKTSPSSTVGNHNTAEIDYHTSEAAKVKRTREQAYFNSYDFDAIEVLPYEDDEEEGEDDDEGGKKGKENGREKTNQRERERRQFQKFKQIHKQQNKSTQKLTTHPHQLLHQTQPQHQLKPQQISNHCSSSNSFIIDNRQQHQQQKNHYPLHPVNSKTNSSTYLQRISSILASKANNILQTQQKQQQQHSARIVKGNVCGVGNKDIPVVVANALSHDNKHLKLSSSETSSTTLSASSNVEEILNIDNVDVDSDDVIAAVTGSVVASSEYVRDETGAQTRKTQTTSDKTNLHGQAKTAASATATNANGNSGNNFLLPRAILKYQSSTLNAQPGAIGTTTLTAGTTNSMPLATNANIANSVNTISTTNTIRQQPQQQQQKPRDVHNFKPFKGNNNNNSNAMMLNSGSNTGLRLKKTSSTSSVITSLGSEDIEGENKDLEEADEADEDELKKDTKVLPKKTIHTKISARASSHQSHYSTDKSASSGYYSSNVCSTYSLEEHIYSEPTLDERKLRSNAKEESEKTTPQPNSPAVASNTATASAVTTLKNNNKLPQQKLQSNTNLLPTSSATNSLMRSLDQNIRYRSSENDTQTLPSNRNSQEFNENLKILESSIENLDRHLKSFPGVNSQEVLVNYTQNPFNPYASVNHNEKLRSSSSYHQLPTIQETYDGMKKQNWNEDPSDDSLMDIDLDSFLLDKDQLKTQKSKQVKLKQGVDNPTFLTEEQEENHYKCAKYINSCPEDAYRVESDILAPARSSTSGQSLAVSVDLYPKRYEEQLHFQNTRELLEDVRDKIRLLTQTQEPEKSPNTPANEADPDNQIPKELHLMINTLKQELESYLDRMNQHSELEIRQLCTGLVKNQHIVKMKNAFERRRSLTEIPDIYSTYEAVRDGIVLNAQGQPISITQQITSIRCSSDPNFKMKRKSLTEVFPLAECYVESLQATSTPLNNISQLQRNLSYHKPVLEQLKHSQTNNPSKQIVTNLASNTASGGDSSEPNDKDSILDWHRKKPSIWEMYYGTNRIQQSLLGGKKNGLMVTTATNSSPSTMCYPSSRPESDFTLDLPRAEQLRIKMEKEKKFRQRCRVITTFLSLVFFLLTVMVVSLVLTRGKRMFGSMI